VFQFTAAGGTAPYSFEVVAGILPDGLTFDNSGLITGTPSPTSVSETFTMAVTDASGATCFQDFTIVVAGGCPDWTTIVWDNTSVIVSGDGYAFYTLPINDTVMFSAAGDSVGAGNGLVYLHGQLLYTGPGCNCMVRVTKYDFNPAPATTPDFGWQILQDSVVIDQVVSLLPRTPQDHAFTIGPGVNSVIEFQGFASASALLIGLAYTGNPPIWDRATMDVIFQLRNAP
jgi:hypothetical protein